MSLNTSNNKGLNGLVRVYLKSCSSTQLVLKSYTSKTDPPSGLYIMTDFQTEGRGQHGRIWESQPAKNVLMSIYLKPKNLKVEHQFAVNIWASLALRNVLSEHIDKHRITVKWPNDLLVDNRKVAGILAQITIRSNRVEEVFLGIGLNLNQSHLDENFYATSVKMLTNHFYDRFQFAERIKDELLRLMNNSELPFQWQVLKMKYEKCMWSYLQTILFKENGAMSEGIILGINDQGLLNLQTDKGLRYLSTLEIEFIRKKSK